VDDNTEVFDLPVRSSWFQNGIKHHIYLPAPLARAVGARDAGNSIDLPAFVDGLFQSTGSLRPGTWFYSDVDDVFNALGLTAEDIDRTTLRAQGRRGESGAWQLHFWRYAEAVPSDQGDGNIRSQPMPVEHYVAYHSVELMGHDYAPEDRFDYRSRKSERQLRGALGALVWLIVGSPALRGRTEYRLAGVYKPTEVRADGDTWLIEGWGTPLRPPPLLNDLPWFSGFLRTQANFSLGFNRLSDPAVIERLGELIGRHEPTLSDEVAHYADRESAFDPGSVVDARDRVIASIVRRRGQPEFRAALLRAYGAKCAFSGCAIESILDAAHIVPYQGIETNHLQNGLLLRTDLHTLFDLGLLGVDVASMAILVAPSLASSEYAPLAGRIFVGPLDPNCMPSKTALEQHRLKAGLVLR
jgi:hypothetical protein